METTRNGVISGEPKKMRPHLVSILVLFGGKLPAFYGQIEPQGTHFQIFKLPWQHSPIFMNFGLSPLKGLSACQISSL